MLIRKFLNWAERASAGERADAAGALAKAYLYADLDPVDTGNAVRTLTVLLDDPSPLVRRALAEAFATSVDAPHHILAALAGDRSDIASVVLERSPLLSDAELIDAVALGDARSQCAVARRPRVSAALAGAIAEVGDVSAALALSRNAGATLCDFAVGRLIERFGADAEIRECLSRREDLGPEMRHALVLATASALADFAVGCAWMTPDRAERVIGEARDRATVAISSDVQNSQAERRRFVAYLQSKAHLTPALLLRALLSGDLAFFDAVLCELSGKPAARVAGLVHNPGGLGFAALYDSAGLPPGLLPAFRAALGALAARGRRAPDEDARLDMRVISRVIAACAASRTEEAGRVMALLRRFEAEATRDEARAGLECGRSGGETGIPAPDFLDVRRSPLWLTRAAA